jgi:hypothetical protein
MTTLGDNQWIVKIEVFIGLCSEPSKAYLERPEDAGNN